MKDDRLSGPGIEGRTAGQSGERHQLGIGDMFARIFIRIADINQSGARAICARASAGVKVAMVIGSSRAIERFQRIDHLLYRRVGDEIVDTLGVALAVDQPLVTHPREVLRGGGGAQPCSPGEFAGAGHWAHRTACTGSAIGEDCSSLSSARRLLRRGPAGLQVWSFILALSKFR